MKLDPDVRLAINSLPVFYSIEKSKDHYYLRVDGHPRIIIAGNHGRLKFAELRNTLKAINRLKEKLEG